MAKNNKDNIQIKFATLMKWFGFDGPSQQNIARLKKNIDREMTIQNRHELTFLDALSNLCREIPKTKDQNIKLILAEFSVVDNYLKSTPPDQLDALKLNAS